MQVFPSAKFRKNDFVSTRILKQKLSRDLLPNFVLRFTYIYLGPRFVIVMLFRIRFRFREDFRVGSLNFLLYAMSLKPRSQNLNLR